MTTRRSKKKTLAEGHQRALRKVEITETTPGPILHDFGVLLRYVRENTVELSKTGLLPMKDLAPLNAAMHRPLAVGLVRPQLHSYPNIQGLYIILRSSMIVRTEHRGPRRFLQPSAKVLASWEALNEVERYMCLLRLWLVWADCGVVDRRNRGVGPLALVYEHMLRAIPRWMKDEREDLMQRIGIRPIGGFRPGHLNVALAELFGLVAIQHEPLQEGEGWRIRTIKATPWGRAVLAMTKEMMPVLLGQCVLCEEEARFALWQEFLAPYLPRFQRDLELPDPEDVPGTYVLTVSLRDAWRQLAVPSACSLDAVARAILAAFGFDRDHLYQFEIEDCHGASVEYHHPFMDDEPYWADETEMASAGVQAGQEFLFRYDFGDNWRFKIVVDRIDPVDPGATDVRQIAAHGEAPRQYEW